MVRGILVVTLASVLGLTTVSQHALTFATAPTAGITTGGGFLDLEESAEAENTTTAGATNETSTDRNMTDVQFLFIQRAQSGSLSQINETAYTLEMNNVGSESILFSDRPERVVTSISTADFVGSWTDGLNSFAEDAPNDVLIVEDTQTGNLETSVIESFDPAYNMNANTLTYTIMTENGTSIELPREFGQTILVIDGAVNGDDGVTHNA